MTEVCVTVSTALMLWQPHTTHGDLPRARTGHDITLLSRANVLLLFGGVLADGRTPSNDLYQLDCSTPPFIRVLPRVCGPQILMRVWYRRMSRIVRMATGVARVRDAALATRAPHADGAQRDGGGGAWG